METYTAALIQHIGGLDQAFDTVYFGGGTPSLLGAERLCRILSAVTLAPNAEITIEANPGTVDKPLLAALFLGGFNRLSLGLQSANRQELSALGRAHSAADAAAAVQAAQAVGFSNISLDLMLGIPEQTAASLDASIAFCHALGVQHISCYLLKLEQGTAFYNQRHHLTLPDEDSTCALYLQLVSRLDQKDYKQYEISNFSLKGKESRHNLKYWTCAEYVGLGPAAHSFIGGKRFYYPRDIGYFMAGSAPIEDGAGGTVEEQLMLGLRLTQGICKESVDAALFCRLQAQAQKLPPQLLQVDPTRIALSPQGFLVSNTIIAHLLDALDS